jgi:hypothetical protein
MYICDLWVDYSLPVNQSERSKDIPITPHWAPAANRMARTKQTARFTTCGRAPGRYPAERARKAAAERAAREAATASLTSTAEADSDEVKSDNDEVLAVAPLPSNTATAITPPATTIIGESPTNTSTTTTTIVGESGCYQIHKILVQNAFASSAAPAREGSAELGAQLQPGTIASMSEDLGRSFPGNTKYSRVHRVKIGGLAHQAGVLPNDIICCFNGPKPATFPDLVVRQQTDTMSASPWKLIEQAHFIEHLKGLLQSENDFTFYVARKMADVSPSKSSSSVKAIAPSAEVAEKAKAGESNVAHEKRKRDGSDDRYGNRPQKMHRASQDAPCLLQEIRLSTDAVHNEQDDGKPPAVESWKTPQTSVVSPDGDEETDDGKPCTVPSSTPIAVDRYLSTVHSSALPQSVGWASALGRSAVGRREPKRRGVNGTSAKDPLSAHCGLMTTMIAQNRALRSQCIELETKIRIVQEKLLLLLKRYDSSSENSEDEIEDSLNAPSTQLEEIMTPKLGVANNYHQWAEDLAAYLKAVIVALPVEHCLSP